jgi:hypothetical protein
MRFRRHSFGKILCETSLVYTLQMITDLTWNLRTKAPLQCYEKTELKGNTIFQLYPILTDILRSIDRNIKLRVKQAREHAMKHANDTK